MVISVLISIFFGIVAATALVVDVAMVLRGLRAARAIRAEIALIDRAANLERGPVRQLPVLQFPAAFAAA